jgi:hypothetical protein
MIDVKVLVRTLTPILTAVALSLVGAAQFALPRITGLAEEHGGAINEHAELLDELAKRTAACSETTAKLEAIVKGLPAPEPVIPPTKAAARVAARAEVDTSTDAGSPIEESSTK